jgi:hypothetical protein
MRIIGRYPFRATSAEKPTSTAAILNILLDKPLNERNLLLQTIMRLRLTMSFAEKYVTLHPLTVRSFSGGQRSQILADHDLYVGLLRDQGFTKIFAATAYRGSENATVASRDLWPDDVDARSEAFGKIPVK